MMSFFSKWDLERMKTMRGSLKDEGMEGSWARVHRRITAVGTSLLFQWGPESQPSLGNFPHGSLSRDLAQAGHDPRLGRMLDTKIG
jgi:hypothetical protein